jgi:hypothetical protein
MPNYLVWRDHGEVEPPVVGTESDGNEVGSREQGQLPEVHNFYRLIAAADEKVNDDTDVTVLQAVTRLMAMKSKYNFSN